MNYLISIRQGDKKMYLQGIKGNEKYAKSATAPTMGDRHIYSEFSTVWGYEKKEFERLTAANYIKTLFDEFRWGDRAPLSFEVEPVSDKKRR